jgi:diguanylate cyclase
MSVVEQVRQLADTVWDSMRSHAIPPTPRNYEVWFAYTGAEKPLLSQRIDALLRSGQPVSPGVMDELYREFFAAHADVADIRNGSSELQDIASEMAHRVTADRAVVDTLGRALGGFSHAARVAPNPLDLRKAAATLGDASTQASDRLQALEQLFSASVQRITDLKTKLMQAEQIATRDALTGLANRRMFDSALLRAAQQAAVEKAPLSLLLLDIDHFKKFNDTYGHPLGDNVLRLVGRVLMDHIKGRDTAARYGGEEFAIILPGADINGGVTVGDQVRSILERRPIMNRTTGQRLGVVTCSVGVAQYRVGEPVGELVSRADQSLYRAKREGRNRVCAEEAA